MRFIHAFERIPKKDLLKQPHTKGSEEIGPTQT